MSFGNFYKTDIAKFYYVFNSSLVDAWINIGKSVLNITYHPMLDIYKQYQNISKDDGQGLRSNLTFYFPQGKGKGWSLKFPNFGFACLLVSCYYVNNIQHIAHGNILFLRFPKWGETSL